MDKVGPLFTASMAEYLMVEPNNQQPQPGIDFCLTPRVERFVDKVWYTNIHDLKAQVAVTDLNGIINFTIHAELTNREKETLITGGNITLNYIFDKNQTTIKAQRSTANTNADGLVLPLVSQTGEKVVSTSQNKIEIHKKEGVVVLEANAPLTIETSHEARVFNQVPGMEVLPVILVFPEAIKDVVCTVKVI